MSIRRARASTTASPCRPELHLLSKIAATVRLPDGEAMSYLRLESNTHPLALKQIRTLRTIRGGFESTGRKAGRRAAQIACIDEALVAAWIDIRRGFERRLADYKQRTGRLNAAE